MTELNLEFGEKYNLSIYPTWNPFIFLADKEILGVKYKQGRYVFLSCANGSSMSVTQKQLECITKYGETMQSELKLKVGRKYYIPRDDRIYTFSRDARSFGLPFFIFIDENDNFITYSSAYIQGIKEHIEENMQKGIKFEVGKKYNLPIDTDFQHLNPQKFLCKDEEKYIFRAANGLIVEKYLRELFNAKEHRELIKNSVVGWFSYLPRSKCIISTLDKITGLNTENDIYNSKTDAIENCSSNREQKYGRFTFEELEIKNEY